jgi:hypothetical protein
LLLVDVGYATSATECCSGLPVCAGEARELVIMQ